MIDWKAKLSSRKLWAALIAFIATVVTAMFKDELGLDAATVDMIRTGVAALCVYIFGEAGVDIAKAIFGSIVLKKIDAAELDTLKPTEPETKEEDK